MSVIDFRGKEAVLNAYELSKIQTWAVFNRSNIMQPGEGEESLGTYLELLQDQLGKSTYTLRLYKGFSPDDITNKTEFNSSFSFQLCDGYTNGYGMSGMGGGNMALMAKITALEKKLKDAEEDKPEKRTIGSTMLGWIENVDDVVKLAGVIGMFMNKTTAEQNMQIVSSLAGIEPKRAGVPAPVVAADTDAGEIEITEEQEKVLIRYANVIERGEKCDPEFLQHMESLVLLAETKPDTYKIGLGFLK